MTRSSTDTVTEHHIAEYRESRKIPARMTLRFVALLRKGELEALARRLYLQLANRELPNTKGRRRKRLIRARYLRVQSERRQRGHIQ